MAAGPHLADARRGAAERVRMPRGEHAVGVFTRHQCRDLAFVGQVQRIEAEDLAGPAHGVVDRHSSLVQADLEAAFERTLQRALEAGELRATVRPRDSARQLVAFVQGIALLGRIADSPEGLRGAVSTTLDGLRP